MSDAGRQPNHADLETPADTPATPSRSRARRLGCALLLLLWFALLLTPCALFYLAAYGEIRLQHRDIPQPHAHPFLLASLVSETGDRGLRFETSWVASADDESLCVETAVRFLLWEYSGDNQNVSFCDCYRRDQAGGWELIQTYGDICQ